MGAFSGSVVSAVVPEFGVFDVPFLFRDAAQAKAVADGPVGRELAKHFADKGLVLLAIGKQGFRHITNSKRPIRTPADVKGLKIRVLPNDVYEMTFKALGAEVVPMEFTLVYPALKDGRIDGEENPITTIVTSHFEQVQKYVSLTGHFFGPIAFVANRNMFEALKPADQAAVIAAAKAGAEADLEGRRRRRGQEARAAAQGRHGYPRAGRPPALHRCLEAPGARIREALRQGCARPDPGHALSHDRNGRFRKICARESQRKKRRRHEPVPAPVAHRHPPAHFRWLRADPGFPHRGGAACGDAASEIGGTVGDLVASADGDAGMARVHAALLSANTAVEKFIRTRNLGDRDSASRRSTSSVRCSTEIEGQFGRLPAIAEGHGVLAEAHDTYRKSFTAVSAAVDHLRNASTRSEALGASASLDFGTINVALANQPERLLQSCVSRHGRCRCVSRCCTMP